MHFIHSELKHRKHCCDGVIEVDMAIHIADVRRALENEEIAPYFQPLVEIHTGRVVGFEVLARWTHPDLGLILPGKFISLTEKSGSI